MNGRYHRVSVLPVRVNINNCGSSKNMNYILFVCVFS